MIEKMIEEEEAMFMDEREALPKNTELLMENGEKIILEDVIGKGASSIVYHAWRLDCMGKKHKARVKECFPAYVSVVRRGNEVVPASGSEDEFQKAKDSFRSAYNRSVNIRNTPGLTNLTADAYELYEKNGTLYTIVSYDEGQTYEKQADNTLKDVFEHVKAVAVAIKKYHENGYLHLDMKPENVLVIPETKEHVILFDFDSVVTFEEVKKMSGLSYTKGFSAPEQVYGWTDRIGTESDIFSLGALTFFKLFGRVPVLEDYSLGGEIDISKMLFWDERYHPGLKKELSYLFQNSLTVSTITRWSNVDEMIRCLDKLITLSDLTRVYLKCCKFNYNGEYFVGRRKELRELEEAMEQDGCRLVFVSGIGGIGKTELVRYYAGLNLDKYDTIAFLDFKDSLAETICSDELSVNNLERGEQEETSVYYKRKLKVLRESKNALVIIDNFDISRNERDDETMKELANCGCKFLFTTREDYKGSRYKQIDVGVMEQEEDLLELFKLHQKREYDSEEWEAVRELCKQVDYHTMAVELFAMHLGESTEKPSDVLYRLREKGGITNFDEIVVRQEKDGRCCEQSVLRHFLVMFDVLKLSETEKEVLKSLALLGAVRIRKGIFFKLCSEEGKSCSADVINPVNSLRRRGWIQEDASEKLSLHSIILDLGRSYLKPTSKDCPHIVNGMISYLKEELPNKTECKIREQLTKSFMEGIIGNDLSYVKLCLLYKKPEYLEKAREICLQLQSEDKEALDLLQKIYRLKMEWFGPLWLTSVKNVNKLIENAKKAEQYALEYSEENSYLGKFYVELGSELQEFAFVCEVTPMCLREIHKRFYKHIKCFYDKGETYVVASDLPNVEKKILIKAIQKFYMWNEHWKYRSEMYANVKIVEHYQKYLDEMKGDTSEAGSMKYITIGGVELSFDEVEERYKNFAQNEEINGKVKRAVQIYQKAIEAGQMRSEEAKIEIAKLRIKQGKNLQAKRELISVLEYENDMSIDKVCAIYDMLIRVLRAERKRKEAKYYAEALVHYKEDELRIKEDKNIVRWCLVGLFHLYGLEKDLVKKQGLWEKCIRYYKRLGEKEEIWEQMLPFLVEYLSHEMGKEEQIEYGLLLFERMGEKVCVSAQNELYEWLLKNCVLDKTTSRLYIRLLVSYCEHRLKAAEDFVYEDVWKDIQHAQEIYKEFVQQDCYCENLMYRVLGSYYYEVDEEERAEEMGKKCNYYFLAEKEEVWKEERDRLDLWDGAAVQYRCMNDFAMQARCLKKSLQILEVSLDEQEQWTKEYLRRIYLLIYSYIQQQVPEVLEQETYRVLKMISKKVSLCTNAEELRQIQKYVCKKYGEIGALLEEHKIYKEAIAYYLFSAICNIAKEPACKQIYEALEAWTGDIEYITEILHQVLQGEIAPRDIDVIVETYDAIKDILSGDVFYADIEKEFALFLEKHHLAMVEFKQK